MKKTNLHSSEDLDILCSIWILACNDENSQITYKGILNRLDLPQDYDIKSLIHSRGELFRKNTTSIQLSIWKDEMKKGKHLPSWISEIEDVKLREKQIDSLKIDDVFRSQFRSKGASHRSNIEIINWGLQHIERLRKANLESKQEKTRMYTSIWIPIISAIVAISAVISSFYVQFVSNNDQINIKKYEIEIRPKQDGYTKFMRAVSESFFSAQNNDKAKMFQSLDQLEISYYVLEPFLVENIRDNLLNNIQNYTALCIKLIKTDDKTSIEIIDSYIEFKKTFRDTLYIAVFKDVK